MSVAAIAGRRIDAADAEEFRFPFASVADVRARFAKEFERNEVTAVVSSAACGADLLALEVAEVHGLDSVIVLPFAAATFRATSVVDRPNAEYWGPLFDRVVTHRRADRLIVLPFDERAGDDAYAAVNACIIDEAEARARASAASPLAIVAWEGKPRKGTDFTSMFKGLAERRRIPVVEINTR